MSGCVPEMELTPDMLKAWDWPPAMLWVTGPDTRCRYVNGAWREFTGRPLEDCLGEGWLAAMHPDDVSAWTEQLKQAIKAMRPFGLECRLRRKDGRYRWYMQSGRPCANEKGEVIGLIGFCIDVTSQRHAQDALRQARDKHREVLSSLREAVGMIEDVLSTDERAALPGDDRLTPRQREILNLIARGYATREIATQLHVSVKTVESHRAQLMQRLNIHDVASLTRFAIRNGMVSSA